MSEEELPVVVISREHKLLPLAHRLRNVEHHPTEVVVWKKSFESAWEGMIEKDILSSKREIHSESVTELIERAKQGEIAVVHDVPNLEGSFDEAGLAYPVLTEESSDAPIRLGFWWDGFGTSLPHLLVYDMGAWPGGLGMVRPGGVTLVDISSPELEALWADLFPTDAREWLAEKNFRGLCNVGLIEDKGKLVLSGWELGWPELHTQAFMGALRGKWGELLVHRGLLRFDKRFTVALPVSVAPWPGTWNTKSQGRGVPGVEIDLNEKLHSYVYWHDVKVDVEEKKLYTAGLDGLVGVVHASGNSFENARQKALGVAGVMGLPEKQFRTDVGGGVRLLEAQLEEHYGVSF